MSTTPRGLATLAFLKTRFDQGQDHLGLFEPFIADAIAYLDSESFVGGDLQPVVQSRSSLSIPIDTINTVLNRFRRKGIVSREGGRFFRTTNVVESALTDEVLSQIGEQHLQLGAALRDFAAAQSVVFASEEDALVAIASFISDNKIPLLLSEPLPDSPLERSSLPRKTTRVIARFIRERCMDPSEFKTTLAGLLEGMVLQDTLLLRDVWNAAQKFHGLFVVVDSPILFAALDLTGVANGIAAKEGLSLLREAGAVTVAFNRTISEMRRILAVYEDRLATAEGRLSLYPTDLTHYALTAKLTPGDIRTISVTLERRLAAIGFLIKEVPKRDRKYTLDEQALARILADASDPNADKPRVRHDVDCVAGVLTLRAGKTAPGIEDSGAVFSTTSGKVIRNVQKWYFGEGEHGAPPVVHQLALTSLAWLKKGSSSI